MLTGPRACGKTTTAVRHARTVLRLDRPNEAAPVADDPDGALVAHLRPVLIDEWQQVPSVLGAVKRAVDAGASSGSFLVTGSARAELLAASWPATGRVIRVPQWGLCERELAGRVSGRPFFDVLFEGGVTTLRPPANPPALRDYVALALRGGFPDVIDRTPASRARWLGSYVDQIVMRDIPDAVGDRDARKLRRYLRAIAVNTAGVVEHKTLYDAAQTTRPTATAYDDALELLFVTEQVPPWHANRLNRLTRAPKRYLVESALLGPLANLDERSALRDGDMLGRLMDTFVLGQLRPELGVGTLTVELFHLRQEGAKREVDLIAESNDGRIVGIEVKSTSAPTRDDARHLIWLRERMGDDMVCGVLFHTGPRSFVLAEGIHALPIATIWGPR
jgi:uncharacterized protein